MKIRKPKDSGPTIVWYFENVFAEKAGADLSGETLRKYRRILRQFVQFCGGPLPLKEVSDETLTSFQTRMLTDGMTERTARECRSVLVKIMRDWQPEWPVPPVAEEKPEKKRKAKAYTLINYFERVYLSEHLKNKKPSYRQKFCNTIARFTAFCRGDVAIDDVTPELFKRYKDWFLECNRGAPATVYGDVVRLRQVAVAAGRCDLRASGMKRAAPAILGDCQPVDIETFYRETFRKQRSISPGYDQQLLLTLRSLRRFYKRSPLLSELPSMINSWIQKMELTLSPPSIKRRRAAVISIWYLAAECGVCEPPNTRLIRKVKSTRPAPCAFSFDEMKALLEACRMLRSQFYPNGIDRGLWWEAFIRVCYDCGLRRGDMLTITRRQIEPVDGFFVLRTLQHKTGDGVVHQLHTSTVQAVNAIFPPDRELVFDWPYSAYTLHDHWKDVLEHAGIDPLNRRNGVQKLRRTSASYLERETPGAATAHLGHRSGDMARLHYLDPKISRGDLPMPPDLGAA